MSIQVSQELIAKALDKAEIRSAAEQAGILLDSLSSKLEGKEQAMLEAATKQIDVYQRLYDRVQKMEKERETLRRERRAPFERRNEELGQELRDLGAPQEVSGSVLLRYLLPFLVTLAALVTVGGGLFALLGLSTLVGFHLGWWTVVRWFTASVVTLLIAIFIGSIIGIAVLAAYETRPERRYQEKDNEIRRKYVELVRELAKAEEAYREENPEPVELVAARAELDAAWKAAEEAIIQNGIAPELRAEINALLTPSYDSVLTVSEARGLAEVPNPKHEIVTEAKTKLERLFETMPGGSIGIAGPRGAGKSTLLRVFCDIPLEQMKRGNVLSVMTSAPVEYVAREFILHVFALVCQRVLLLEDEAQPRSSDSIARIRRTNSPSVGPSLFTRLVGRSESRILALLGTILLTVSVLLVNLATLVPARPNVGKADSSIEVFSVYIDLLGIKPAPIFYLGLLCIVLSCVGVIATRRQRRNRLQQDYEEYEYARSRGFKLALVDEAHRCLDEIRWQQSYSSGWGGSLKLAPIAPVVAEAKEEASTSLARNQLSLPEIVQQYEDFLNMTRAEYRVIVGIDELDEAWS